MAQNSYDIIICGAGPAGLTAAIYAARAGHRVLVIEEMFEGGQMTTTPMVENYPSYPSISGVDLSLAMGEHAKHAGAEIIHESVQKAEKKERVFLLSTARNTYEGRCVILASGAKRRLLGCEGEQEFTGRGVSYCATCDGGFFKGKVTAVVGGGNTALEDALYLSGLCEKVYLIHRRDEFRGAPTLAERVRKNDKIELVLESVPVRIAGEQQVTQIVVKHVKDQNERALDVAGVFIAVGTIPRSDAFADFVATDDEGYIQVNERLETSVAGVFAAGDARKAPLKQIVTAAADGAYAAHWAGQYLQQLDSGEQG